MEQPAKKGMSTAAIVLIVLAVLIVLGMGGCGVCVCLGAKGISDAKDRLDQKKADAAKATAAARTNARPVSAKELIGAYKANEVSADATYKGQWVRITGARVREIRKNFADKAEIIANLTGNYETPEIVCNVTAEHVARAAAVKKGQPIIMVGRVTGEILTMIEVHDCELAAL